MTQSEMASTIAPPRLARGAKVAVCAPAGPVPQDRLDRGLSVLGDRYDVVCDRDRVLSRTGYLAGDDDARADELNRYLRDPDIRAIFVARGGYGITRILGRLDADALRADPVPIVGFSDATALLMWAGARAGVRGIHGPLVAQLAELPDSDVSSLFSLLESTDTPPPIQLTAGLESPRAAKGRLWGGNLCVLSHLVGTGLLPKGLGVFFLEEVGERPYRLDRYLTHLHAAGALDEVVLSAVGQLVRCEEDGMPSASELVAQRLSEFSIPSTQGVPAGHGTENRPLPMFCECELEAKTGLLRFLEAAVA